MTAPLVWLDLCSGLGGASQPALDRGWRVIRIDIDRRFKPDIVADVRALPLTRVNSMLAKAAKYPDVLWASPPCEDFSKWGMRCFFPDPPYPDMTLAQGVWRAINALLPQWYIVENVWAARPFFNPIFGPVAALNPGHAFWGRLPCLLPQTKPHKGNRDQYLLARSEPKANHRRNYLKSVSKERREPAEAAKIPYEIGAAICRAVEARQP